MYLWTDPINHFVEIFNNLSSYNWEGYNLYFGEYILGSNLPWHYVFVWIGITTPLLYIFFFFCWIYEYYFNIKKSNFFS